MFYIQYVILGVVQVFKTTAEDLATRRASLPLSLPAVLRVLTPNCLFYFEGYPWKMHPACASSSTDCGDSDERMAGRMHNAAMRNTSRLFISPACSGGRR